MSAKPDFTSRRRFEASGPDLAAMLVGAISLLVLIGWKFELTPLKSVMPGFITMKANTALCFGWLALALWLGSREWNNGKLRVVIVAVLCGATVALSAATLAQYFAGWQLSLDEWLFLDPAGVPGHFPPGRMAPISSINFILLSFSILHSLARSARTLRFAQVLAIMVFLSSFQALLGYALGLTYLFGSAFYTQMAVHTAVAFVILSLGVLLSRSREGMLALFSSDSMGGLLARRLILACVLIPPALKFLQVRGERFGWFDSDFGTLFQVMMNVTLLTGIAWHAAAALYQSESRLKDAEGDFHKVQSQLSLISNALPALVSYVDSDQRYLFANQAYQNWFGPDGNPMGKTIAEVIGPEAYAVAKPAVAEVLAGRVANYEAKWNFRSGKARWVKTTYTPDFDENGQPRGFTILVNDVTDLKEAVEARDTFLSLASHELKTPITALLLRNGIRSRNVQRKGMPSMEEYQKFLEEDKIKILQLVKHIEVMLDISRINANGIQLQYEEFELGALLEEVLNFYTPQFENAGVIVTRDIEAGIRGKWDRFRLEQVITNLFGNSIKYGNGSPVHVSLERNGAEICLRVADFGIGIRQEDQERIFRRFERGTNANQASGFGLGLFLVKDIAIRHGGDVGVESREGGGSTFTLRLPIEPNA